MTGASLNGSTLYTFGNGYGTDLYTVQKFNPTTGSSTGQYMTPTDFPGLSPAVYDIAFSTSGIWVARDEADSPILRYNTMGEVTGSIMGSVIPSAAGLAIDIDGFLWVSDPDNDKIYKLDLSSSASDNESFAIEELSISPFCNPFTSTALINAVGFSDEASVEVFDLHGRLLHSGFINGGSFSWDATLDPDGMYLVNVRDQQNSSSLRMTKI